MHINNLHRKGRSILWRRRQGDALFFWEAWWLCVWWRQSCVVSIALTSVAQQHSGNPNGNPRVLRTGVSV